MSMTSAAADLHLSRLRAERDHWAAVVPDLRVVVATAARAMLASGNTATLATAVAELDRAEQSLAEAQAAYKSFGPIRNRIMFSVPVAAE